MAQFRKKRPIMALDLTPLIDVVFLLIIFFMVSTTFNKYGKIDIDLPSSKLETPEKQDKSLEVIIDKHQNYFISENGKTRQIDFSSIDQYLKGVNEVTVSGDKDLKYQTIMDTVTKIKENGITNLGINFYE
ncbi:Tol-Pal system protein TolR [Fusobacterium sp. DD29]|uniref:ExbD/TolR family protein n=1 Tax=unclassified Fusobacterium TaxID=2648384 RepID=UPI001B8B2188|nr:MULTISPECIES: biopolymer transporter ExbD [unclassified Fusobacterium]MBR8748621.1 Tol-Pal system protein TolR [Fusobacterium sp. DD29]MBR8760915.1 Tol-Pal system protein TolR [Fusobacterium sp. DD25]MBR8766927.1 Tol-Pal system protein TolR [Fusobacterium sp. DD43]MBR8770901.1 Tol-Pal system protein TolR [Fusobacterium sp. DD40]MBR8775176.1 Tol-Pal system protein TolR [Fusobacterium sp. DD17]